MKSLSNSLIVLAVLALVNANAFADDSAATADSTTPVKEQKADDQNATTTTTTTTTPTTKDAAKDISKSSTKTTSKTVTKDASKDASKTPDASAASDAAKPTGKVTATAGGSKTIVKTTDTVVTKTDLTVKPQATVSKDVTKPAATTPAPKPLPQVRSQAPAPKNKKQAKAVAQPIPVPTGPVKVVPKDMKSLSAHANSIAAKDPRIQLYINNYIAAHPSRGESNSREDMLFRSRVTLWLDRYDAGHTDTDFICLDPQGAIIEGVDAETIATYDCVNCGSPIVRPAAALAPIPQAALPAVRTVAPGAARTLPVLTPTNTARTPGVAPIVVNTATSDKVAEQLPDVFATNPATTTLGANNSISAQLAQLLLASGGGFNQPFPMFNQFNGQPGWGQNLGQPGWGQPNYFGQPNWYGQQALGNYRYPAPGYGNGWGQPGNGYGPQYGYGPQSYGPQYGSGAGFGGGRIPLVGLGNNYGYGGYNTISAYGGVGTISGFNTPPPVAPYLGGTSGPTTSYLGGGSIIGASTGVRGPNPPVVPFAANQVRH